MRFGFFRRHWLVVDTRTGIESRHWLEGWARAEALTRDQIEDIRAHGSGPGPTPRFRRTERAC